MSEALDAAVALHAALDEEVSAARLAVVDANQALTSMQKVAAQAAQVVALLEHAPVPDPTPVPTPSPIPDDANTVRVGAATYPLAGINPGRLDYPGGRGPDQLVAYRAPVTFTVTNLFGTEVTVMAGAVLAAVDRQATGQSAGVIVPVGAYVLSGHGKARDWLNRYAVRGARVELVHLDTPAPTPVPVPAPGRRTIALYLKRGSVGSAQLRASAAAGVNQARVAFLQGDPLGLVSWSGAEPVSQLAAACAAFRAAGGTVLPSIGGQAGAAPSDATKLTAGVVTFERDIPSDGWDVDVEAKALNVGVFVEAAVRLARSRESTWITAFTPPGGAPVPLYLAAAKGCVKEGLRVQVGQQLYGATGEHISRAAMLRQTQLAVDATGDPASVLIGMWPGPKVEQWTIPECQSMLAGALQEWPTLGGCYAWTETGAESPAWATAMSAVFA